MALVLTRQEGESIVFSYNGETIEIKITKISEKSVKLELNAEQQVKIIRSELKRNN